MNVIERLELELITMSQSKALATTPYHYSFKYVSKRNEIHGYFIGNARRIDSPLTKIRSRNMFYFIGAFIGFAIKWQAKVDMSFKTR